MGVPVGEHVADGPAGEPGDLGLRHLGGQLRHRGVRCVGGQVEAGEHGVAGDGDLRALGVQDALPPALGVRGGGADHAGERRHHLDLVRTAAGPYGLLPDRRRVPGELLHRAAADEHALAVLSADPPPGRGGAGLEEHRGALRGAGGVAVAVRAEVRALVLDQVHLGRVGEAAVLVLLQGVRIPGALPVLVDQVEEVLGHLVAVVVRDQVHAEGLDRGVGGAGGHDVPAEPAAGQLVQGGQSAGERVRRLHQHRAGHHQAQVGGAGQQRRGDHERVQPGQVQGLLGGDRRADPVDLRPAPGVGQEQEVQPGVLAELRDVPPVPEGVEQVPAAVGVAPGGGAARVGLGVLEQSELEVAHGWFSVALAVVPRIGESGAGSQRAPRSTPALLQGPSCERAESVERFAPQLVLRSSADT